MNTTLPLGPRRRLPGTGVPPGSQGLSLGWLVMGAMLSIGGCALVLKASLDARGALPSTLYVRLNGLTSFDEFYEVATGMERSVPARTTTATLFDSVERCGELTFHHLAGSRNAVRSAAEAASRRTAKLRRTSRDHLMIDLD